jgi:biotin-(acetyl-CoA carboxylase) ligase
VYLTQGFAPFQAEYEAASVLLHKRVRFAVEAGVVVEGVVTRIGADGTLYVRPSSAGGGDERGFLSGEVAGIELAPGQLMEGHPDAQ